MIKTVKDNYIDVYLKTMCLYNWADINIDDEYQSLDPKIQKLLSSNMNLLISKIYKYPLDLKSFKRSLDECNDHKLIYDFKFEFDYRKTNNVVMGINISERNNDFRDDYFIEKMKKNYDIYLIDHDHFDTLDEFYQINIICLTLFDLMQSFNIEKLYFNKAQNEKYFKVNDDKIKQILDKFIPYSILLKESNIDSKTLQLKFTIIK